METQIVGASAEDAEFVTLLERSRAGDSNALLRIIEMLEPDMKNLSRGMRMEQNDAMQTLRTELIELVLRGRSIRAGNRFKI